MRTFEISSRKNKNGRRKFKLVLHQIYPDSCVDEVNQVGNMYNKNGITWIKEYCENALPSIEGMSLRCEFSDEERTEILGHGETGISDGDPVFEDAVVIGTFTNAYIDDIENEDGDMITACIGEGEIDALCYHNFVKKLDKDIANGVYPSGSVEIMHDNESDHIVYKYGYKDKGRIPQQFIYSGYALLGVTPADDEAKLIELNEKHKEDMNKMNESEIKTVVAQVLAEMNSQDAEMVQCREECETRISEANAERDQAIAEKNELQASSDEIKTALDQVRADFEELDRKYQELWAEHESLQKALGEAKARERLGEMNDAIKDFSEEEKDYAKAEIEEFNNDPENCEINSIVSKIYEGIGKAARENEKAIAEQNAQLAEDDNVEDIFSDLVEINSGAAEDNNIF